jgi:hypothetical protein
MSYSFATSNVIRLAMTETFRDPTEKRSSQCSKGEILQKRDPVSEVNERSYRKEIQSVE